jgi:hypothetical protein
MFIIIDIIYKDSNRLLNELRKERKYEYKRLLINEL